MKPSKEQLLTHERLLERLKYNKTTGAFTFRTHRNSQLVGKRAGSVMTTGYIEIQVDGLRFLAHRLAWFYVNGKWPEEKIDHRDGNPANNRYRNLREASQAQNTANKAIQSNNRSGVQGVVWDEARKKWRAYSNKNGKHHYFGRYDKLADAVRARRKGALLVHGEFAPEARL